MTQIRKNQRYYIKNKDHFLVQLETNPNRIVECILNDISAGGACIILDRQVFVQRDKLYPFVLFEKKENGELEIVASTRGKMAWYLAKDYKNEDKLYLGIEFNEEINLHDSIISDARVSA